MIRDASYRHPSGIGRFASHVKEMFEMKRYSLFSCVAPPVDFRPWKNTRLLVGQFPRGAS